MKKFRLFVSISLLGALSLLSSCPVAFDTPEKIRVKSNADISLSIPESEVDMDRILNDMEGDDGDMEIYEYTPSNPPPSWDGAKAYLIRYELDEINFQTQKIKISEAAIEDVRLSSITIPDGSTWEVNVNLGSTVSVPGNGSSSIPSVPSSSFTDLGDVQEIKIEEGYLDITASNFSVPVPNLNFFDLDIKLGGEALAKEGGKHSLNGKTITPTTTLEVSGNVTNHTNSSISLNAIKFTPVIAKITEVKIQTNASHYMSAQERPIDLKGIPDGVNAITFKKIGVDLEFGTKPGGTFHPARVDGLPVALESSFLNFSINDYPYSSKESYELNSGCKITGADHVSSDGNSTVLPFSQEDYTLRFNGTVPNGKLVNKNGNNKIAITVNPPIDDGYDPITCYNLVPGPLVVRPKVNQTLFQADVNLNTLARESRNGTFPDDPKGLEVKSMFGDMGGMGDSMNFEQLDLYLYMNGDRDMLEDAELTLTARSYISKNRLRSDLLAEDEPLINFNKPEPVFPAETPDAAKEAVTDDVFIKGNNGTAQFYTPGLAEVINRKPHNLWLNYEMTLAENATIPKEELDNPALINIRPEIILVMPMRMFMAEDDEEFGTMKFKDQESDGEKMIGIELNTDMDTEFDL